MELVCRKKTKVKSSRTGKIKSLGWRKSKKCSLVKIPAILNKKPGQSCSRVVAVLLADAAGAAPNAGPKQQRHPGLP